MNDSSEASGQGGEPSFSLVRNDLLFRLQRKLGLIPQQGLGIGRRALFWALLAWLPVALWAFAAGRLSPIPHGESLLQHFGVNVRCLIAIPLFIVAEGISHQLTTSLLPYFETSGLLRAAERPQFRQVLLDLARLRDATYPWIIILGLIFTTETLPLMFTDEHELAWAADGQAGMSLGFGGWWYLHVSRAIFLALVLAWLWRVILLTVLFHRISKLDLEIVPTHPDGVGGLGFIQHFPKAVSLVLLGISSVTSAKWAHQVLYHGTDVQSLKANMIGLTILLLTIFGSPYLVWLGKLSAAKKRALLEYGALVGHHGRLVRRRWIDKVHVADEPLLSAPELGPVADTAALYEAVTKMRSLPFGKASVLALIVPIVLPMLAVVALQVPIKEVLLAVLKALA